MIVLDADRATFAASRRGEQDKAIAAIMPTIVKALALKEDGNSRWYTEIVAKALDLFNKILTEDGGRPLRARTAHARLANDLRTSLTKTGSVTDHTGDTIANFVTAAAISAATVEAAHQGTDAFLLEWITMHDSKVRHTHVEADGQRVRPGRMFSVGGSRLRWPGDTRSPIKEWINCRCATAPVPVHQNDQAAVHTEQRPTQGVAMSQTTAEPTETDEAPMLAPIPWHGVLAPEGVWSGDKRMFAKGALSTRNLPLPLTYQKASSEGHGGSVTVASIDYTYMDDAGLMWGGGTMMSTPEADEVMGLLAHFGKYGVSVDADDAEFEFDEEEDGLVFTKGRVCSASVVAIPAFAEAFITLGEDPNRPEETTLAASISMGRGPGWLTNPEDTKRLHDYWTKPGEPGYVKIGWGTPGDFNRCRVEVGEEIGENSPEKIRFLNQICAQWHKDATGAWPGHAPLEQALETPTGDESPAITLVASGALTAPSEWFADPGLSEATPITITEDGRIFGHLAEWGTCHTGFTNVCVQAPPSANDYAYFLTGEVMTTEGPIRAGNLCIGGGHAPHALGIRKALAYYDSTSTAVADVNCGEDDHGIWLAGWVRPYATEEQIYELRASSLSGDWRKVRLPDGESMELIAALGVNSPGFPVQRPRVGTHDGEQVSLVAAAVTGTEEYDDLDDFAERVAEALENRLLRSKEMARLELAFGNAALELEEI